MCSPLVNAVSSAHVRELASLPSQSIAPVMAECFLEQSHRLEADRFLEPQEADRFLEPQEADRSLGPGEAE